MSDTKLQSDAIVFLNVSKAYLPQEDLTVRFERSNDLLVGTRDWVGLFRVGWTSTRDYYTFEWAPTASDNASDNKVVFSGRRLPPDDGCFYQFCYVSREGVMRGASRPFQFTKGSRDHNQDDVESVEVVEEGLESIVELRHKTHKAVPLEAGSTATALGNVQTAEVLAAPPLTNASVKDIPSQAEHQLAKEELAKSERRVAALEADLAAAVQSNADMAARLGEAQNQVRTSRDMQTRLSERLEKEAAACQEAKAMCEALKVRCQETEIKVDALNARCTVLAAEKAGLLDQLRSAVKERDDLEATLCVKLQAAKASRDQMERTVEQSAHKIKELEEFVAIRECQQSTMEQQFRAEKQQLEERLLELQEKATTLQQQLESDRQRLEVRLLEEQKASASELLALQRKLHGEEEGRAQLEKHLVESEQELKALREELANVRVKEDVPVQQDSVPLCVQPPSGYVAKAAHEALQIAYENMEKYYRKSSVELESSHLKLSESGARAAKLSEQCDELRKRIEMGKLAYETVAKENSALKRTLRSLEEQGRDSKPTSVTAVGGDEKLRASAAEATARREEQLQQKVKELEEEVKRQEREAARRAEDDKDRLRTLERKLQGEESRCTELAQDKEDLEAQYVGTIQDMEHQLADRSTELESVTKQLTLARERVSKLEQDMSDLHEECNSAVQELTRRNDECQQLQLTVKRIEGEKERDDAKIRSLEQKVLDMQLAYRTSSARPGPTPATLHHVVSVVLMCPPW